MKSVMKLAGVLVAVVGAATTGAVVGGQVQAPEYPKVIVANQAEEAVPVSAVVSRMPAVTLARGTEISLTRDTIASLKDGVVRLAPAVWEYRELRAVSSPGVYNSLLAELTEAGADGWETTGLSFSDKDATIVILKRQK